MAETYTTIKQVLDNLMQHPLLQDLSLERAVNYTAHFINIVGAPRIFETKNEVVSVSNYRAQLPCDYGTMVQVKLKGSQGGIFRYSQDSFHYSDDKSMSIDLTYKIQGGYIYTSIAEGDLELVYEAIATDEEGYPLVPENSSFIRALEAYIKLQQFTILFDLGKLQAGVFQNAQQQYAWAVGDCQTEFNRLSLDKAESFFNSWNTLLLRTSQHSKGFVNNGRKENLKMI